MRGDWQGVLPEWLKWESQRKTVLCSGHDDLLVFHMPLPVLFHPEILRGVNLHLAKRTIVRLVMVFNVVSLLTLLRLAVPLARVAQAFHTHHRPISKLVSANFLHPPVHLAI